MTPELIAHVKHSCCGEVDFDGNKSFVGGFCKLCCAETFNWAAHLAKVCSMKEPCMLLLFWERCLTLSILQKCWAWKLLLAFRRHLTLSSASCRKLYWNLKPASCVLEEMTFCPSSTTDAPSPNMDCKQEQQTTAQYLQPMLRNGQQSATPTAADPCSVLSRPCYDAGINGYKQ